MISNYGEDAGTVASSSVFSTLRRRQSIRRFSSKPIPDALLYEVLDLANRAPSGYNLQPWHFVVVLDHEIKRLLHHIAMDQVQVAEAPVVVAFVADPSAWGKPYRNILDEGIRAGVLTETQAKVKERLVASCFRHGPLGITGVLKRILLPFQRLKQPTPDTVTSKAEAETYVCSQTMFAVSSFIIAAESAGLSTCPIDQFDEPRLKNLLAIPKQMCVPAIVACGYMVEGDVTPYSVRAPLDEKTSLDIFKNTLSKKQRKA